MGTDEREDIQVQQVTGTSPECNHAVVSAREEAELADKPADELQAPVTERPQEPQAEEKQDPVPETAKQGDAEAVHQLEEPIVNEVNLEEYLGRVDESPFAIGDTPTSVWGIKAPQ